MGGIGPWAGIPHDLRELVTLAGAGALIVSRHPENPIGWLFCGFALLNAVAADAAQGWEPRATEEGWPSADAGVQLTDASWQPSVWVKILDSAGTGMLVMMAGAVQPARLADLSAVPAPLRFRSSQGNRRRRGRRLVVRRLLPRRAA